MKTPCHPAAVTQNRLVAGLLWLLLLCHHQLLPRSHCQETRQEVDSSRLQHDHAADVHHLETRGRVLAVERMLTAKTQLPDAESIKLQYTLFGLNVRQFDDRPFCLSFVFGRGDKLVKEYLVPQSRNRIRLEGPGGMQEDPKYCGVFCSFMDTRELTGPSKQDVVVDISRCILQLNISIPAANKPYKGPTAASNPVKLSSVSIVGTYLNIATLPGSGFSTLGDGVVELVPPRQLKLPAERQLGWWKLLLQLITEKVQVVSDRKSMKTGLPTKYVPATRLPGGGGIKPGAVMGVSDMLPAK